jgi:redox-sensitive bicupin YhaK (pirin superfamily)
MRLPEIETPRLSTFERKIARISDPALSRGGTAGHRARRLIDSEEAAFADPFLLMAEDWVPRGAFALHPHRGIETVTFVIDGEIEHYDNAGHRGIIRSGDAQWMTAGRGVLHEENAPAGTIAHTLQLWVNLPSGQKMSAPRYQDLIGSQMPMLGEDGVDVRVFSGTVANVSSSTLNYVPILMLEVRLRPGAAAKLSLPSTHNGFVFVIEGSVSVGSQGPTIRQGQLAWLTRSEEPGESKLSLRGGDDACRVLLFSGPPLREPIAFGGPFVMNTEEEIQQAFRDFRSNRFPKKDLR